ncbi:hypothetical protein SAMN05192540_2120 [Maribacter dokdonensis]|uniref:Uncharacterized protein n=1 Tax=Maribacter dokdonensis TaxID=320912 RepID=A0A1H4P0Y4_9FLAO|nr:hypothetical protein SAMN05192540_2120 [Maribacter dokdonensis]
MVWTKTEHTEQAEALEQHQDIAVPLETTAADTVAAQEHTVLAHLDQAVGLAFPERLPIETPVVAQEVILRAEAQEVLADLTVVPVAVLEAVVTVLEEAVLVAALTEALEAALGVQAVDPLLDHLVLQEAAAAVEETKI